MEVCGGAQRCGLRCKERCTEVHGGVQRCVQRYMEVVGKNQDFMLIKFLNAGI